MNDSKPNSKPSSVQHIAVEYCRVSTIHGLKYLVDRRLSNRERILWALLLATSLTFVIQFILWVRIRWISSPMIYTYYNHPVPGWRIPFPTVTVCPPNRYRKEAFDLEVALSKNRSELTLVEKRLVDDLLLVCPGFAYHYDKNLYDNGDYPLYGDQITIDNIIKVAPTYEETIECQHIFKTPCKESFQPLLTSDGLCFSYNLMPNYSHYRPNLLQTSRTGSVSLPWGLESGYDPSTGLDDQPFRAVAIGLDRALILVLKTNLSDLDYFCSGIPAFKITLTSPDDVLSGEERPIFVSQGGMTQLAVTPMLFGTSPQLKEYHPSTRNCYFEGENRLAYLTTFTHNNCYHECLANLTMERCNCVSLYMPRNENTPICGIGSKWCVREAEELMDLEYVDDNIEKISPPMKLCRCLPACKSLKYKVVVSQGSDDIDDSLRHRYMGQNISSSLVYIFINGHEFFAQYRAEVFGVTEFIAYCGGLLSLCCGFSVLSIAELIYYFTLRLWTNTRQERQKKKINTLKKQKIPFKY